MVDETATLSGQEGCLVQEEAVVGAQDQGFDADLPVPEATRSEPEPERNAVRSSDISDMQSKEDVRKSGRPLGISKIDLRTVWGSKTPMPGSEEGGQPGTLHLYPAAQANLSLAGLKPVPSQSFSPFINSLVSKASAPL